jgi:hypothetical protein
MKKKYKDELEKDEGLEIMINEIKDKQNILKVENDSIVMEDEVED